MSRTVLRGGTVLDGVKALSRHADVALVDGRITAVGEVAEHPGDKVVDCDGRFIMPGFIDAHSHSEGVIFHEDVQLALLRQGVTTIIGGQDGVSYAPGDGIWAEGYFRSINGPHPRFSGGGVSDLLATYDAEVPLNVGYLVPAGTVRQQILGLSDRKPTETEIASMQELVHQGMKDGALGLSTGLDYVPGIFADTEEIARLCEPLAQAGGLYVTHMRGGYEANSEVGVREIIRICLQSGVSGHISHFHAEADHVYRLLATAQSEGVDLSFDMYPYTRGCTLLSMALLPPSYSAIPLKEACKGF